LEEKKKEKGKRQKMRLGMAAQAYNPTMEEVEARGSQVSGQYRSHTETLSQKTKKEKR
jgi:hypothetical protein